MLAFDFFTQFFLVLVVLPLVRATVFVTAPSDTTTCNGGQFCLVQWLDNGAAPLLSTIGPCFVGLFNGDGKLVQQIEPIDVASVHSLQFTPDPAAGPDSNLYYINFTSVNHIGNPPRYYTQYSPFFRLTDMTGSFSSPVPSDTSSLAVPTTVASPPPNAVSSTIVISHSSSPSPVSNPQSAGSSSSSFVTSRISSTLPSASSSGPSGSLNVAPSPAAAASGALRTVLGALLSCNLSVGLAMVILSI